MSTHVNKLANQGKIGMYTDAKKGTFIYVTDLDVERSIRFAPDQCALAKATCRAVPNTLKAFFYRYGVYIATFDPKTKKNTTLRYMPSLEARKAIETFDKTGVFKPGPYYLEAPSGSATLKEITARGEKRKGAGKGHHPKVKGTAKRRPILVTTKRAKAKGAKRSRLGWAFA